MHAINTFFMANEERGTIPLLLFPNFSLSKHVFFWFWLHSLPQSMREREKERGRSGRGPRLPAKNNSEFQHCQKGLLAKESCSTVFNTLQHIEHFLCCSCFPGPLSCSLSRSKLVCMDTPPFGFSKYNWLSLTHIYSQVLSPPSQASKTIGNGFSKNLPK